MLEYLNGATNPASACVVFRNGKPAKRDYRKFNIRTVEGPDDFASMKEAVYRRYKRLRDDGCEHASCFGSLCLDGARALRQLPRRLRLPLWLRRLPRGSALPSPPRLLPRLVLRLQLLGRGVRLPLPLRRL